MQPSAPVAKATPSFVLLSPLTGWREAAQSIAPDMRIRQLTPFERAALASSESLLRHHDLGDDAAGGYWICYGFENSFPAGDIRCRRRLEAAFKLMLHAMYAVHVLLPMGASNLFLLYRVTEDGPVLEATQHRPPFLGTVWARRCDVPPAFADEFPVLLERIHEAFRKPTLRLQIPVWLLEQGLIAPDRHIRILLWATGLDGITRSGGTVAFTERLCSLLGADTSVFPPCGTERKPGYTVSAVAGDLYQLRNEMAHGLPFHEKFRKTRGLLADDGAPVSEECAGYRYDQVLEECAAFLLCKALREVFLRNRAFDMHTMCWSEGE